MVRFASLRFLRPPRNPKTPKPAANSGSAAGRGTGTTAPFTLTVSIRKPRFTPPVVAPKLYDPLPMPVPRNAKASVRSPTGKSENSVLKTDMNIIRAFSDAD
jgi:hypothetical protein